MNHKQNNRGENEQRIRFKNSDTEEKKQFVIMGLNGAAGTVSSGLMFQVCAAQKQKEIK